MLTDLTDTLAFALLRVAILGAPAMLVALAALGMASALALLAGRTVRNMARLNYDERARPFVDATRLYGWSATARGCSAWGAAAIVVSCLSSGPFLLTAASLAAVGIVVTIVKFAPLRGFTPSDREAIEADETVVAA